MECEARIDNWSDRELMLRLALVLSLEEARDEVVEGSDDGGVDSKLAVILLPFINVDADEDMEVFAMLDVATAAAAAAAAGAATLRAALIFCCLLQIVLPSRKTLCKSFIRQMSSLSWRESGLPILFFRAR